MGLVRGLRVSPCEALRKDGAAHVRTSHRPGPAAATSRAVHRSISHLRHTPLPRRSRCALQLRASQGEAGAGVSTPTKQSGAGLVFGLGAAGAWDHEAVGFPVVRCFLGDNEQRWMMWYSGRAGGPHAPALSSGCIGIATSTDGINWKRGTGPVQVRGDRRAVAEGTEVGVVLMPNEEEVWTFDTCHVAVGDVQVLSSNAVQSSGGIYWMFYHGGDYNETDAAGGSEKETGRRMRIGLALSQDGLNFARIEGEHYTHAVFDYGKEGEWDALGASAPQVVRAPSGDLWMYYQGAAAPDAPASVGLAVSESGFRWEKKGQVFSPGGAGSFDECGVERPFVLPLPTNKGGGYVMYYEATDSAGVRSIGAAQSQDGLSWERVGDKPVLAPSQEEGAWDAAGVAAPNVVIMGGGRLRLYYAGSATAGGACEGVGIADGHVDDVFSFTRIAPAAEDN